MNQKVKKLLGLTSVLIVLGASLAIISYRSSAYREQRKVWTKTICNEDNYCIDVKIICEKGKLASIKPMTEGVKFSKS